MYRPRGGPGIHRDSFGTGDVAAGTSNNAQQCHDAAQMNQDNTYGSERPAPSHRLSLRGPPPPPRSGSATLQNYSEAEYYKYPIPERPPSLNLYTRAQSPTVDHLVRTPLPSPDGRVYVQTQGTQPNLGGFYNALTNRVPPHIKTKAPENASSLDFAQLEMESRRLELVWQETEKQWKDKHGTPLARSQDMAFRRRIEGGVGIKDDSPIDKEWRDMWKNTSNEWAESEARWRKEVAHRRSASRNDDSHFHTVQSDSRNASVADDDKVMNAILSHFEKEMEKRRQRAERKRLEEVEQAERKRREEESDIWEAVLERESGSRRSSGQGIPRDFSTEHHWLPDRLLRPGFGLSRIRSSSVVVEPRPSFQRSRSGSVTTIVDPLTTEVNISPLPTTRAPPAVEHARVRRSRSRRSRSRRSHSSCDSRDSFEAPAEEDPVRIHTGEQRSEEVRKHYLNSASQHLYNPATDLPHPQPAHFRNSSQETERDTPRATGHQRGPSAVSDTEAHSPLPSLSPSISTRDVPQAGQADGPLSIVEEVAKLEREQAALARRIQELRAAREANKGPKPSRPVTVVQERERGREQNKELKVKDGEKPRAKSQVTRKHSDEGAIFKAMQEWSRKTEQQGATVAPDFNRKPEPAVITPEPRPATTAPTVGEPSGGRLHFMSDKPSAEDLPSPTPPRVRTPFPESNSSAINANTSVMHAIPIGDAVPAVHDAMWPPPSPRAFDITSQPAPRLVGESHDGRLYAANTERPKFGSMPTLSVPRINASTPPFDAVHDQGVSPLGGNSPRVTVFDPERTSSAQASPIPKPETNSKLSSPLLALNVHGTLNQDSDSTEVVPVELPVRMDDSTRQRMETVVSADVTAAAAATFDSAGGKKRTAEAEIRAQEERRATKDMLAQEQRRADEDQKLREEQSAEEAQRRGAAQRREREERARYEQHKRDTSSERRRRWESDPSHERASRAQQPTRSLSALDAWNSYELRWSSLSVASSDHPIGFQDIPWPLFSIPTGPESITPQAISAFILSPLHSEDKSRKERLRNAMLRWHYDKFEGRLMSRIEEGDQSIVKEAVERIHTSLIHLLNGTDPSNDKVGSVIILVPQQSQQATVTIGSNMSVHDVIKHLVGHGCQDLTESLDLNTFPEYPHSHGGFSDVYRGCLITGPHVAVKALRISTDNSETLKHLKRAARELYTWSNCRHPNVLQLLGLAIFRGRIGMVSLWMNHGTLPRYLSSHPGVNRCHMSAQICDGLSYLHGIGIVHGDLKGANVLTLADGTPVLTDFGNSTFLGRTLLFTETTREGNYTARWAAPELLVGSNNKQTRAADVYALGMTVLEIITGEHPYQGKGDYEVIRLVHKKKRPERPTEHIPADSQDGDKFWRLLRKCWAYDPEKRPSAAAVTTVMKTITPEGLKAIGVP